MIAISFLFELAVGLAMLLRPRQMRQWLMPDYQRYEGKFAATSLLTYRFVGIVAFLVAALNGYAYVQLIR